MKKLFVLLIVSIALQGCAVYDWFSTPTASKSLNKDNFSWVSDTTDKVAYHFYKGSYSKEEMQAVKNYMQKSIQRTLSLINQKEYPATIDFFVTPSKDKIQELTDRTGNAFAYQKDNIIYAVIAKDGKINGSRQFNYTIVGNLWGTSDVWLEKGFAIFSDDNWHGYKIHELNKYLLDKNKLLSISDLFNKFKSNPTAFAYPQAGSLVKYLYEKYGIEKFKTLWQKGSGSIEKIYGKSLAEIEKEWKNEIKKYDAQGIDYLM
jgi:hypothetical protein